MATPGRRRYWRLAAAAAVAVAAAGTLPAHSSIIGGLPVDPLDLTTSRYIVMAPPGQDPLALVDGVLTILGGGSIAGELPLVNGVVADLTAAEVDLLPDGLVTPDAPVLTQMQAGKPGPKPPPSPTNVFRQVTGATSVTGNTGAGIGVAVLDTGIAPLPDFGSRLQAGKDLTAENDPHLDGFGHGTFIAGLVAGNGASSAGKYVGEAPGANLIPVKVAGADGVTDVATVIEGLQWIYDNPDGIDVINMSLGAVPVAPTALNPLDHAVEVMWARGFVVVTSAGNEGPARGTITSPGDDPLVVTVGALDDRHTTSTSDDTVPSFSSHGPTTYDGWWKPDLIAPGRSLVSVISNESAIWRQNTAARIGSTNFIGSGTSFAAAITSGAAAMLLAETPSATPDNVKAALLTTTNAGPSPQDPFQQGHGVLNVAKAVAEPLITMTQNVSLVPVPDLGTLIPLISTQVVSSWASVAPLDMPLYPFPYPFPYSGPATSAVDSKTGALLFHSAVFNSGEWNSKAWNSKAWNSKAWNSSDWESKAWNDASWNGATWN